MQVMCTFSEDLLNESVKVADYATMKMKRCLYEYLGHTVRSNICRYFSMYVYMCVDIYIILTLYYIALYIYAYTYFYIFKYEDRCNIYVGCILKHYIDYIV